jgi:hypothetical protein
MNKLPQSGGPFMVELSGGVADEASSTSIESASSAIERATFGGLYVVRWKTKNEPSPRSGQSAPMRQDIAQEVVWRNNRADPSIHYWIEPAFAG